jgi:hypothetical protein
MRTKDTTVAEYPVDLDDRAPEATSAHVATIVSLEPDGTPLVDLGEGTASVPARWAVRATRERVETAIAERHETVVVFEDGDRCRPLIVGFIEPLEPRPATPAGHGGELPAEPMPAVEVDVDGRRLRVTARDEIVLQCGSASITLRRNGRVIIRGTYVETHSDGTNRIKGGQVQIN